MEDIYYLEKCKVSGNALLICFAFDLHWVRDTCTE